jgi:hypothetical protein
MKIGVAARPKLGETVSGDAYYLADVGGQTLVCLIDGIGHGEEGHNASAKMVQFLEENGSLDLDELIARGHQELRGTRGAVVGVALIRERDNFISYAGIGNISAVVVDTADGGTGAVPARHLISVGGIVGCNLRKVKKFECPYRGGDALIMYTDGVSSRFSPSDYVDSASDPQEIADRILKEQGKDNDDATVIVIER